MLGMHVSRQSAQLLCLIRKAASCIWWRKPANPSIQETEAEASAQGQPLLRRQFPTMRMCEK